MAAYLKISPTMNILQDTLTESKRFSFCSYVSAYIVYTYCRLRIIASAMRREYTDKSRIFLNRKLIESANKDSLRKNTSYHRYLVFFMNERQITLDLKVTIYKDMSARDGAKKYFSCLPAIFALPREPYSAQFIINVLYSGLHDHMSLSDITDRYLIGKSSYQRWARKYMHLYRAYMRMIAEIKFLSSRLEKALLYVIHHSKGPIAPNFSNVTIVAKVPFLRHILHLMAVIRIT